MSEQKNYSGNWDEIRIAYHVARLGTLSAAAGYLGVHHATVIRHIDALEARLGSKLFQRNPRGYNPTEAGLELLQVATKTEDLLLQLAGNLKGRSETVSGDLVVTSLDALSPQITPLLVEFGRLYPKVRLNFVVDERTLQLEYGEAHVALRAGSKPQEMNNIAQSVGRFPGSLFAHKDYVERYGMLLGDEDAVNHRFVGRITPLHRVPFQAWMSKYVPDECVVYKVSEMRSYQEAVLCGAGIGFLPMWASLSNPDLVQMYPSNPDWDSPIWLVTHVDLHRTAKVSALAGFLKQHLVSKCRERIGITR
jgi:DNA-binding transcriptional LysR family regulator